MVSFREYRQIQKAREQAHVGPGAHDAFKPFGSDLSKVNFGSKYKFDPGTNPGPGQYEPRTAGKVVHPKSYEAFIKRTKDIRSKDPNPDAGQYEPHQPFGTSDKKMTW